MSQQFNWTPNIAQGEWLRPMEAEPFTSILSIVPSGFEAYARVFHPVERDRPSQTKTWHGINQNAHFDGAQDIAALLETERTTWAAAAKSFGTSMHSQAQYARLVRSNYGDSYNVVAPDGWRYSSPHEGSIDSAALTLMAAVLARHTTTAGSGVAAIWEGWGGLVSSAGVMRLVSTFDGMPARYTDTSRVRKSVPLVRRWIAATAARWQMSKGRAVYCALPGLSPNQPAPGTGLLTPEAATGPRFELLSDTGRSYILFEAGANDLADATWPDRAPWVDEELWAQSPSILWPDDHAWVLATEIDHDSTLIAGTHALIAELIQTPGLEVLPISPQADLTWDGDTINRTE